MGVLDMLGLARSSQVDAAVSEAMAERDMREIVTESLADLELALEDEGWDRLTAGATQQFSRQGLQRAAEVARVSTVAHPLMKRGLMLRTGYVWGAGVQIAARDTDVNDVVQAFLDDQGNRRAFTGAQARARGESALFTDGNRFVVCFTNPRTGKVQARTIPFDQMQDVITNPDDESEPWYYLRQWTVRTLDQRSGSTGFSQQQAYYPALGYRPFRRPQTINGQSVMWDAPVYHVKVNDQDGWAFGIGDAYAALTWARGYRDFLADWAVLMKSLSQIAWRATAPGAKAHQARQLLARRPSGTDAPAGNPNTVGATVTLPPEVKLEAISKSGATLDSDSGRPLAAMIAAALGVPVTMLLADPGVTGARATAETLDKPTEDEMNGRRGVWEDALRAILGHVVASAVRAPQGPLKGTIVRDGNTETVTLAGDVEPTVDFTWPDLTQTPVDVLMKALAEADQMQVLPDLTKLRLVLAALNVKDADEIIDQATDEDGNFISPVAAAGQVAVDAYRAGRDPAAVV